MKKLLCLIYVLLIGLTFISSISAETELEIKESVIYNARYAATTRVDYDELDYGIIHIKDLGYSTTLNYINGTETLDPQQVNVLEIPVSDQIKVVNWSYSTSTSWRLATVKAMAKDFEENNPGWVVLGGVNGDFFDINAEQALPYQTKGVCVNNGEVVKATTVEPAVGFTNNGTSNSLLGGHSQIAYSDAHYLTIYNDDGDVIKEVAIDKINEIPTGDEIAVYFSHNYIDTSNGGKARTPYKITLPIGISNFTVTLPERGYAQNENQMYGKGIISKLNYSGELNIGLFSIVTENEEIKSLLNERTLIRVQQNIVGDFAECDNITAYNILLLLDGKAPENFDTVMDYRHPRTMIGKKADGTIVLFTVDGRQETANMYGMTPDEMSATMQYYGCVDGYNVDGGGSTTMILRNDQGEFDVLNSPSDGGERNDANSIFVVAPEMNLKINQVTDTTIDISYLTGGKDIEFNNVSIVVTSGDFTKEFSVSDGKAVLEGLLPNKDYELTYSYDCIYNGNTTRKKSRPMTFSTGMKRPNVNILNYEIMDNYYVFNLEVSDPSKLIGSIFIKYDTKTLFIETTDTMVTLLMDGVKEEAFELVISYNVGAIPNSSIEERFNIEKKIEEPEPIIDPVDKDIDEPILDKETNKKKKCGKKSLSFFIALISSITLFGLIIRKKH